MIKPITTKRHSRRIMYPVLVLVLVAFSFVIADVAFAGFWDATVGKAVSIVVGVISFIIVQTLGLLLTMLMKVLVNVAQFSDIIDVPTVVEGWVIIRDICNMFFILALLIIAFATILRIENYNLKKLLPKLLLAAVLINFSRTIFGLIIDFSQVIMLTFVSGFGEYGHNNFVHLFSVDKMLSAGESDHELSNFAIAGAMIAGVIAMIISVIVITVILAVLVVRIIMLWIYTILSPLIVLGMLFPPFKGYVSSLWQDFVKQVMVGPIMAFFLWLALVSADRSSRNLADNGRSMTAGSGEELCAGANQFFCEGNFQTFIIVIGLLMGGLMVSQKVGGMTAKAASKTEAFTKNRFRSVGRGVKTGGGAALGWGADTTYAKTGYDLNLKRSWNKMQDERKAIRRDKELDGELKAGQKIASGSSNKLQTWAAMTGTPGHAWRQIFSSKGRSQLARGGKKTAERKEEAELGVYKSELVEKGQDKTKNDIRATKNRVSELDRQIESETDKGKKAELEAEKRKTEKKLQAAQEVEKMFEKGISGKEKQQFAQEKVEWQKQLDKSTPAYNWRAKSAEQKMVREKMDEIKDITDSEELNRILDEARQDNDKNKIKAVSLKMAQNGDENEYLGRLEGDTGFKGLQSYADRLVTENGFDKQEAYDLASQVSNTAKRNNVWSAAHAFTMKNGEWQKTDEETHAKMTGVEFGKSHPQACARNNGRKAYGTHDEAGNFHLSASGVEALRTLDNAAGIKEVGNNMNMSAASYLTENKEQLEKLRDKALSGDLIDAIYNRVSKGKGEGRTSKLEATHEDIKKALGESTA